MVMEPALALPVAMAATALGGAGLAAFLLWHARTVTGAVPLAAFLLLVGAWALGLVFPGHGGPLMALAPLGGATFVHFSVRLAGRGGGLLPWSYAVAALATALALVGGGGIQPWAGTPLYRYDGMGLVAGGITLALAGFGFALLVEAWRSAEGAVRRRLAFMLAACGLGLASVAGLAFPLLNIRAYPWPLLVLPLYLAVLAYGALRYDLIAGFREESLRDLRRRQTESERQRLAELGALAATVAHDLRNPMNIVAMAVADADAATRAEVKTQLARMEALVRDLLEYAKPWAITPTEMDAAEAIAMAVRNRGAEMDVPPGLTLRADPLRLAQALDNVLDNAFGTGARVLVAAERCADGVLIHVCDDGPGIPEDIRASLFLPFVSRSPGGTGLGLAIVAKVMAAHGGGVTLAVRPGWTTCFTLRFPS